MLMNYSVHPYRLLSPLGTSASRSISTIYISTSANDFLAVKESLRDLPSNYRRCQKSPRALTIIERRVPMITVVIPNSSPAVIVNSSTLTWISRDMRIRSRVTAAEWISGLKRNSEDSRLLII